MDIALSNILLAIDDGNTTSFAQQKALDLAHKFRANLTVLLVGDEQSDFSDTIKFLRDFTSGKNIELTTLVVHGDFNAAVEAKERTADYDILVVGTSCTKSRLFKSPMCYDLATSITCPMLLVKKSSAESRFGSLLLPLYKSPETRQKVKYAVSIAQKFNSTIHILLLSKTNTKYEVETVELFARQTERYLAERGIKFTVSESFGENIASATEAYSRKVKADIVFVTVEPKYAYLGKDRHAKQSIKNGHISMMRIPIQEY